MLWMICVILFVWWLLELVERLHTLVEHSRLAGHRHLCGTDPGDSGTTASVNILPLAEKNEVFEREVVEIRVWTQRRKLLPRSQP